MSKPIILSERAWNSLYSQLTRDHNPSVILIREKMKSVLGFTVRRHREWRNDPNFGHRYPEDTVRLDFYNEPKRTMFMLKYSEYLNKLDQEEDQIY